jgi:hypothetical protein
MNLQTAPVLMLFPPTVGPDARPDSKPIQYDFQNTQSAEHVNSWLGRHLPPGPRPPIVRPFNYIGLLTTTTIVLGLITFITLAKPYVLPVIQNRNLWAGVSLIAILLFTSGHMFNHIRKVPYVSGDGKGGITYFAGGFSSQLGMETQIVAAMCKHIRCPPRPSNSHMFFCLIMIQSQMVCCPLLLSHLRSRSLAWSTRRASRWPSSSGARSSSACTASC